MPKLTLPSLPPGPRQTLSTELHTLHRRAGWPSVRDLARALGAGVASPSRIHDAFTKPRLPAWGLVQVLVTELAQRIPRTEPETEAERFHALWEAAAEASAEAADVSAAPVSRDFPPPPLVLSPPPLVPPRPSVPPARTNRLIAETRSKGKQHYLAKERHEKILRVNAYLEALERDEEPEVPLSRVLQSMISLLQERGDEVMAKIRYARRGVKRLVNSTDSVHEDRVLSARFEDLDEMEAELNKWLRECRTLKGVDDFAEMRRALDHKDRVFSSKITLLTRPLDLPD